MGRLDGSIELIGRAIAIDPRSPSITAIWVRLTAGSGQWERAIASLRRAIELNPGLAVAHRNLGNAL